MEHKRSSLFMAMLLLAPLTAALPVMTNLNQSLTTTYTVSEENTVTSTSAITQTYYASTTGMALIQAPINLPPEVVGFAAPKGKCSQYTYPVSVKSGTILNVEITSTYPANVYLLPSYTYQTSSDGCEITLPAEALVFQANFTTYTLRWTAPETGVFYIILTGPTTVILLTDQGSSQPVNEPENITYASSTSTSFQDYLFTTTATYLTESAHPLYLQPQSLLGLEILGLLGLIACAGALVVALIRKRKTA